MDLVLAFCGFVGLQAISRCNRNGHMVICRAVFNAAGHLLEELLTTTREDINRRRWLLGRFYDIVNILLSARRVRPSARFRWEVGEWLALNGARW